MALYIATPVAGRANVEYGRLDIERETTLCVLKRTCAAGKNCSKHMFALERCFGLGRKQKRKCRLVTTHRLHCQQNRDAEQDGLSAFRGELGRRGFFRPRA